MVPLRLFTLACMLTLTTNPLWAATRNVVLIVADDLGLDLGCYGNTFLKTPNIDRLAAEGTRFSHAFCTTASCSASRSVILTGLYNHANGQFGHQHGIHHFSVHDQVKTLPVLLGKGGYRTARVGKFHVAPDEAFKFDLVLPEPGRNVAGMANSCGEFLNSKDARPFFLYFATHDPHRGGGTVAGDPLQPNAFGNRPAGFPGVKTTRYEPRDVLVPPFLPDTPSCRAELAQYYQSVARLDQGLGRLFQILKDAGKYEDTLIVFVSDNGIPFPGAKTTCYEPGIRLPCIVRHPDAKTRGVVNQALLNWADITPTILDYAKVTPREARLHGRSFASIVDQENPPGWDEVYASHTFHEITMYYPMRVVRDRRYKLIWNIAHPLPFPFASDLWSAATWQDFLKKGPDAQYGQRTARAYQYRAPFELYDLEHDPHEIHNLANQAQYASLLNDYKAKLKAFQKRTADPWISKWEYE